MRWMWLLWTFLFTLHSLLVRYQNHATCVRKLANPNHARSQLPLSFWSSNTYIIYYQSEDSLMFIKWSYIYIYIYVCWLLSLKCIRMSLHIYQTKRKAKLVYEWRAQLSMSTSGYNGFKHYVVPILLIEYFLQKKYILCDIEIRPVCLWSLVSVDDASMP